VLSRTWKRGQGRRVLKSSGKLGMVAFGVLMLFFVGYLLWSLMFPPMKPQEEGPVLVRPQMRLTAPKMAPDMPTDHLVNPSKGSQTGGSHSLPEPDSAVESIKPTPPKPSLPPAPPVR